MNDTTAIIAIESYKDSVSINIDSIVQPTISMFDVFEGEISPVDIHSIAKKDHASDWLSLIFLGIIVYLIFIRFVFRLDFLEALKGLFKIESLDQVSFEKKSRTAAYVLAPISSIVYAFYIYYFINPHYLHANLDHLFLVFSFIISALFFLKVFLEKIVSIVFNSANTFQAYLSDYLYILGVSGVFQLVFIILFVYSQIIIFLWFALSILVLFWLFRLIRALVIGYSKTQFSKSYIFLYLCSLEIIPIIWVCKWLINNQ